MLGEQTQRPGSGGAKFGALRRSAWVLVCTLLLVGPVARPQPAAAEDVYTYRSSNGVQHFTNVPTDRRFQTFSPPAQRVTTFSLKGRSATRQAAWADATVGRELRELISETASRFDLEPALMHAVVRAESGFDPRAVSSTGARGLMQLMPETAREVGVRDVFHPRQNLEGGASYLRGLIDRFSGDVHLALAAYNAGPGAVEAHGGIPPYAETEEYLRRVLRFRREYLREALRVQRNPGRKPDRHVRLR